jgi:dolichol kinase
MAERSPGAPPLIAAAGADGGAPLPPGAGATGAPRPGIAREPTGTAKALKRELLRKRIHLSTAVVPAAAWLLPRSVSIALLVTAVVAALAIEWSRRRVPWVRYFFLRRTRVMLRGHERRGLAGATWMAVAYLVALVLFPLLVAVAAMLYNALGDAAAAIVGRRWGRHRTRWGKSWEGALAGLGINLAVGVLLPGIGLAAVVLGAAGAAALEFLPLPLDDNLRVTLGGGLALWVGTAIA